MDPNYIIAFVSINYGCLILMIMWLIILLQEILSIVYYKHPVVHNIILLYVLA